MAWTYSLNVAMTGTADATFVYNLKTALKTATWTVPRSSDGTTFNSSGDQIGSAAAMANTGAWFAIRDPNGRSWLWQRVGPAQQWIVFYSRSAGFTGGSALVCATATDQIQLGPPAGTTYFDSTAYKQDIIVGDSSETYSFLTYSRATSGQTVRTIWFQDAVTEAAAEDVDPVVVGGYGTSTDQWASLTSDFFMLASTYPESFAQSVFVDPSTGQTLYGQHCPELLGQNTTNTLIGTGHLNPYSDQSAGNKIDTFPLRWAAQISALYRPRLIKGKSRLFRLNSSGAPAPVALDSTTGLLRVFWGFVSVPWNGSTTPT